MERSTEEAIHINDMGALHITRNVFKEDTMIGVSAESSMIKKLQTREVKNEMPQMQIHKLRL